MSSGGHKRGAGLFLQNRHDFSLDRVLFVLNSGALDGGGAYIHRCTKLAITRCTFLLNAAKWGGGLFLEACSDVTISDCTFVLNFAVRDGGAVTISDCSDVILTRNRFVGNVALRSARNVEHFTFHKERP